MKYGISELSVIPVRKEQLEQSEIVTQILFGETFQIIEENKDWTNIKVISDSYVGWINSNCITKLETEEYNFINNSTTYISKNLIGKIRNTGSKLFINIPFGSTLPNFDHNTNSFTIKNSKYELINNSDTFKETSVIDYSLMFINAPYLWGGKNPFGIDCSGLSQIIYKALGHNIPRDANQQVNLGKTINFISDVIPGDLAFFDNEDGDIVHVGIILEKNKIIHSSIKVRIDKIDQQGIFNTDLLKYTHKLRVIKRILD